VNIDLVTEYYHHSKEYLEYIQTLLIWIKLITFSII